MLNVSLRLLVRYLFNYLIIFLFASACLQPPSSPVHLSVCVAPLLRCASGIRVDGCDLTRARSTTFVICDEPQVS